MRAAAKASDSFAAVNACQQHMLAAARAHTDRVVLEAFIEGIHECQDPYIASILGKVCDLYALATIEENRGWYMEHERFDGARSKAVTEAVDALCLDLRGKALELVEGLGVEEGWLNAAILD
jgi:acyl-CoA oxidase